MRLGCKRPHKKAAATELGSESKMSEAVRTLMRMDAMTLAGMADEALPTSE